MFCVYNKELNILQKKKKKKKKQGILYKKGGSL